MVKRVVAKWDVILDSDPVRSEDDARVRYLDGYARGMKDGYLAGQRVMLGDLLRGLGITADDCARALGAEEE